MSICTRISQFYGLFLIPILVSFLIFACNETDRNSLQTGTVFYTDSPGFTESNIQVTVNGNLLGSIQSAQATPPECNNSNFPVFYCPAGQTFKYSAYRPADGASWEGSLKAIYCNSICLNNNNIKYYGNGTHKALFYFYGNPTDTITGQNLLVSVNGLNIGRLRKPTFYTNCTDTINPYHLVFKGTGGTYPYTVWSSDSSLTWNGNFTLPSDTFNTSCTSVLILAGTAQRVNGSTFFYANDPNYFSKSRNINIYVDGILAGSLNGPATMANCGGGKCFTWSGIRGSHRYLATLSDGSKSWSGSFVVNGTCKGILLN